MSKKAFDKIAEGLNEALAFARGELKGAKLHVPRGICVCAVMRGNILNNLVEYDAKP